MVKNKGGRPTREDAHNQLLEMDIDAEIDIMWRELVVKVRRDIPKMTPNERANLFSKIIPYYKDKRGELEATVKWDLDSLAAKYKKVRESIDSQES